MESIGFVGAGMMGHGICVNLLKAGHPLAVFAHRNRKPIDDLLGRGATEAGSLEALCAGAEVLMICVNSAQTVEDIVTGPQSATRHAPPPLCAPLSRWAAEDGRLLRQGTREMAEMLAAFIVDRAERPP